MENVNVGSKKLYGKYRGIVTDNKDPESLGRIRVSVPSIVDRDELGWAVPCVPCIENRVDMFFVPNVCSSVWIEFEEGDINKPIFSGCFWS
jgi:hypothetical protein